MTRQPKQLSQNEIIALVKATPLRKPRARKGVEAVAEPPAPPVPAPAVAVAKKERKPNPWITHTKKVHDEHPDMTYKEVLSLAKASYTKSV